MHDVDVAVFDAQAMHPVVGATRAPATDDNAWGMTSASLIERGKESTHVQHAVALVTDGLEALLGGQVLAIATLHLAVVLAPRR